VVVSARVVLSLDDNFATDMKRMADVAADFNRLLSLRSATWEPHDWSEWE
jgi:hypothetical protein